MNSKKNFISLSSEKIVNKINDLVIGEDSNDYLTVNSETRFHSDVNVGGSSIRLHSSDDTNPNNFISILDQDIHSVHAQTLRKIHDLQIDDNNNGKYLKFDDSSGIVASTVSDGGSGGGSGIVNNRIDGDLTIGEDDSEMLTIASKLHIPGGESGQVLTKGTDGSIEYGPTAFPSVSIPSSGGRLIDNVTITGNSQNVTLDMGADYADYEYFEVIGVNVVSDTDGYLLWRGKKVSDNSFDTTATYYGHSLWTLGHSTFGHDWGVNNRHEGTSTSSTLLGSHALNNASPGPHNFRLFIYGLNKNAPTSSDYTVVAPHGTNNSGPYKVTGGTWQPSLTSNYIICNKIVFDTTAHHSTTTLGNLTSGTLLLYGYKTSGTTFTTANPLLANPSTADKGKIVTVNATGDDLQYGPEFIEVETVYAHLQPVDDTSVDTNFDNGIVTYIPISSGPPLGKTSYSVGGITLDSNNQGIKFPSNGDYKMDFNINIRTNSSTATEFVGRLYKGSNFIQETNTFVRQVSQTTYETLNLTAIIKVEDYTTEVYYFKVMANGATGNIWGWEGGDVRGSQVTIFKLSTTGAITSFTQEQALAGAGGTAAFTAYGLYGNNATDVVTGTNGDGGSHGHYWNTNTEAEHISNNDITADVAIRLESTTTPVGISYEFTTPQIITKYRIWMHYNNPAALAKTPKQWEFRAATDKSTYNSNNSSTYTVLDSQSNVTTYPYITGNNGNTASNNLNLANEYNLSTIGAYKYYVLHVTSIQSGDIFSISELALYGGGFTIPSQVGHSGKILKTNGTTLEWSAPVTGLLPAPVQENKGKIVTVNAAGDDLQYGANFRELACNERIEDRSIIIQNKPEYWIDLALHNDNIYNGGSGTSNQLSSRFYTDCPITVSHGSKVKISASVTLGTESTGTHFAFRLGKKVDDIIVWGNSAGETNTRNDTQTDPKGDVSYVPYDYNNPNRTESWFQGFSVNHHWYVSNSDGEYIDTDPTNGLPGSHTVTYFLRVFSDYPESGASYQSFTLNIAFKKDDTANDRVAGITRLSATEIGLGAITSFTQEQALAGAGGTATFTNTFKDESGDTDLLGMDDPRIAFNNTINNTANDGYWHNQPYDLLSDLQNQLPIQIGVNFTTPQIVTKYRIWARTGYQNQAPKSWQIRAAIDKATYDSGTFIILDSRSDVTSFPATSTSTPSDNLSTANEYNLSTIGAYKYYVFYFTESNGGSNGYYMAIGELALYGGGFTIPSQVGHSGKTLKTNGTALEWSAPLTGLLPPPVPENKGKIVTVNSAGDDLQYGPQVLKHNMNFKNIYESNSFVITGSIANNNPAVHPVMNITITPQLTTSKVMVTVNMMGEPNISPENIMVYLRRTINGVVTDILPPVDGNKNRGLGQIVISLSGNNDSTMDVCNFHYIDEPNTISEVRYDVLLVSNNTTTFHYNSVYSNHTDVWDEKGFSFISAEEKFANDDGVVGALTSFTQEQALAGAGGTAAFTVGGSAALTGGSPPYGTLANLIDNVLDDVNGQLVVLNVSGGPWIVTFNFTTPQIVTKYRIWGRYDAGGGNYTQSPKNWELRAATDSSTYNASLSSTYTVLDSQSNAIFSSYVADNITASDNLSMANEYNLSTIGAYKYYVLHITGNGTHANYCTMSEIALYGGGFTIPSQVGNTGRLLTTDGTSLGWSTTSALPSVTVPEPTSTNKGRALVSTGTGIEFSDFNSGVSTGFKVYKSGTAFEEVTGGNAVLFDQTITNVGAGHYDKVTGIYTVPVTGYYNIFANFEKLNVGFSCEKDGDSTGSGSGTWTTWSNWRLSTVNYNLNTCIDLTTGIFTAPCDGYYQANANLRYDGISGSYIVSIFSIDNNTDQHSGAGVIFDGNNVSTDYHGVTISNNFYLNKGQTVRIKSYRNTTNDSYTMHDKSAWSMHLIEQKSEFVLQKSTNSGTSYTDIKKAKNNLSETVYLNQNDLIRITSDSTNKLTFNQGELNNSFGAHLLNSGNSTSPIPIYGFNAQKNDDHINPNGVITGWSITENSWNFSEPTSNFNTSSGLFTIPISGYYKVCAMLMVFQDVNNDSSNFRAHIEINGDTTAPYAGSLVDLHDQTHGTINISTIIKLNKDDTIGIYGGDNGTIKGDHTSEDTVDTSTFSCFLLASDTQTNTRQMGLSPIVPLHQLGHDQFAEGKTFEIDISNSSGDQNLENSSSNGGLTVSQMGTISTKNSTYFLSNTEGNSVDSTTKLMYINRSGSKEFIVPSSPYTSGSNWTNNQDFIRIRVLKNYEGVENYFYGIGSFTIDLSKILTNYIGMWNILINHDDDVRFKINGETFFIDAAGNDNRVISIFQKYINVEWTFWENTGNEYLYFDFYMVHPTSGMEIAEPVMPSITLPTPNSNNNGKVLVSNGSGYALENSGARNQKYISIYGLTAPMNISGIKKIEGWDVNNLINIGSGFTFSDANDTITIKNVGYYKIKANITFYIESGGTNNERSLKVQIYINDSAVGPPMMGNLIHAEGDNNYATVPCEYIAHITSINSIIDIRVGSSSNNAAKVYEQTPYWSIEDMTPSAVPSINVPLPVAAHAGKALTVNSQGTGLEYGESSGGESKWSSNSNKIYYNTDNVGIGTDLSTNHHAGATSKLDVDGRITAKYLRISFRDTSSLNSHIIANREYNDVNWQAFPRALDMSDSGHGSNVNSFPDGDGVPLDIQQYRDIRNSNSSGGRGGAIIIRQAVRHENYWRIGCDTDTGADSELQFIFGTSGDGFQAVANGHSNVTFTGQHRCIILNKTETEINNLLGQIVVSSGNYCNLDLTLNPTIDESLPIVDISNTENSKKCFGIISHIEEDDVKNEGKRLHKIGNSTSILSRATIDDRRMYVNSLGEGSIWVCNKNSNLENGDYISSSSVPGYGMKQTLNEGILTNYTVAKITSDCNFSLTKIVKQKIKITNNNIYNSNNQIEYEDDLDSEGNQQMIFPFETRFLQADATQITEEEYNTKLAAEEEVYIACFVGCTYHCG